METENKTQSNPYVIPAAIVVAGALIAGAVVFSQNSDISKSGTASIVGDQVLTDENPAPKPLNISIDLNDWPAIGNTDAPVVLAEYADFACPYCAKFAADTLPSIKKDYVDTGKILLIYKDFPVVGGDRAAEAAHCAREQGKYWEYHNLLFEKQSSDRGTWNTAETHRAYAESLGLDADALVSCFNDRKYQSKVQASAAEAMQNGGQGTPFFIVNKTPISGAQPYSVFQAAIEAELAK